MATKAHFLPKRALATCPLKRVQPPKVIPPLNRASIRKH
jgi:hypothetical protein